MYCILQYCSPPNNKSVSAVNRSGVALAGAKNCSMAPLAWRKSCAPTPVLLKGGLEVSGAMMNAIQESLTARVQGLHERAVWPRSQVPDARVGQIVESTPSRPRLCYLARIADAGSVPCSALKGQMAETVDFGPKPRTSVRTTKWNRIVLCPVPGQVHAIAARAKAAQVLGP